MRICQRCEAIQQIPQVPYMVPLIVFLLVIPHMARAISEKENGIEAPLETVSKTWRDFRGWPLAQAIEILVLGGYIAFNLTCFPWEAETASFQVFTLAGPILAMGVIIFNADPEGEDPSQRSSWWPRGQAWWVRKVHFFLTGLLMGTGAAVGAILVTQEYNNNTLAWGLYGYFLYNLVALGASLFWQANTGKRRGARVRPDGEDVERNMILASSRGKILAERENLLKELGEKMRWTDTTTHYERVLAFTILILIAGFPPATGVVGC